jgi:hypothetical protein
MMFLLRDALVSALLPLLLPADFFGMFNAARTGVVA